MTTHVKRNKAATFVKSIYQLIGGLHFLLVVYAVMYVPITLFVAVATTLVFISGVTYLLYLPRVISQTIASQDDINAVLEEPVTKEPQPE